ncbi:Rieske (2Fe-2S) protein [Sphingobium rhizovicinum]|uniref:Rieske (2Fe-2S) protein n=1 Tax=Sphingobium rhizovicinum TaxID=432308 RepID=A0ABV7NIL3_9SPHN
MHPDASDPDGYIPLIAQDALVPGRVHAFVVRHWPIIVVRTADQVHALLNRCSHAAAPLDDARVRRDFLICPLHGAQFDLATGSCRSAGSGYLPIRTFPVRVTDGMIAVRVPDTQPTVDDLPLRP